MTKVSFQQKRTPQLLHNYFKEEIKKRKTTLNTFILQGIYIFMLQIIHKEDSSIIK